MSKLSEKSKVRAAKLGQIIAMNRAKELPLRSIKLPAVGNDSFTLEEARAAVQAVMLRSRKE
ncbi:hypothetical protein GTP45_02020 [Pseudoduganella sp. FT55W]|uniref:Uncharacterized protein n=1 Tax=Duganella rivi TaxID=2666083 RepID=A0A7X4GLB8_9BURK|nr:hypothetical protein [Duganella rivi]MYM65610.1 hypothetical protein [Duganella rivi]